MKTSTSADIIKYIENNQQSSVKELVNHFGLSPQAIQRQLKKLIESEELTKVGTPPRVYYILNRQYNFHEAIKNKMFNHTSNGLAYNEFKIKNPNTKITKKEFDQNYTSTINDVVSDQVEKITFSDRFILETRNKNINKAIDDNFINIINGNRIESGISALQKWCIDRNIEFYKTAEQYIETYKKYQLYKNKSGLISATHKFTTTFHPSYLDKGYYIDFYSVERFGKTKLGTYILYAKQSQSIQLMKEVFKIVDEPIMKLIKSEKIDAVGFIPPTISRKIQFMTELKRMLAIELPEVKITKIKATITIAQKTLSKLSDREQNARNTIFIDEKRKFKNILLIDDAVGSGSTFNEVAKKIRERGIVTGNIIGIALTGSANGIVDTNTKKGFDVVNEV
jgi:hypothetical protein